MRLNIIKALFLISFLFLILDSDLYSVSLSPEVVERLRKEGSLEEVAGQANLAREKGVWLPNPIPSLKRERKTTAVDTIRAVVLLVDFSDNVSTYNRGKFDTLLFSKGFVLSTGSMRDFYWENSYQTFEVIGDVYGWYRMPKSYVAYTCTLGYRWGLGYYPYNAQKLVADAVDAADPDVDFSKYDRDDDGDSYVDALFVVHAGLGAEETGNPCHIWSHSYYTINSIRKDGVWIHNYSMEPERSLAGLVHIGVFCHEFGHILGAKDLYDTDYSSEGLGVWSVMAFGSWNNDGKTPGHFDAWTKKELGWTNVNQLSSNQTNVEILQAETSPVSYRLWTSGGGGSEYFLVENRQKTGFDKSLPGEGLLIYHVDEGVGSNDDEWCPGDPAYPHYQVALEQADGQFQLEGCYGLSNQGNLGDPFPGGSNKRAFDDTTAPSSRDYSDGQTQVAVWNISDSDSSMYANMDVSWSRPGLYLNEFTLNDSPPGGDGDGKPEAGETVKLYFTISNLWLPINATAVTGSADTAGINFTHNYAYLGNIGSGEAANDHTDPIVFVVDSLFPERQTTFTLHVEGNTIYGTYTHDFEREALAGTGVFDVEENNTNVPKSIKLFQNYPNPFNPNTSIQFTVNNGKFPLHTSLKIYNVRGELVRTLVEEDKPGGNYAVFWDGRDGDGRAVSSGIYFYKLTSGSSSELKKMVLLK